MRQSGEPSCYYCGCNDLQNSEYGEDFKYCMDCVSDIYCGQEEETLDPNQIQLELDSDEDEKAWNESFGIKDTEYEDMSDNYDGSMKHNQIVNEYLTQKEYNIEKQNESFNKGYQKTK